MSPLAIATSGTRTHVGLQQVRESAKNWQLARHYCECDRSHFSSDFGLKNVSGARDCGTRCCDNKEKTRTARKSELLYSVLTLGSKVKRKRQKKIQQRRSREAWVVCLPACLCLSLSVCRLIAIKNGARTTPCSTNILWHAPTPFSDMHRWKAERLTSQQSWLVNLRCHRRFDRQRG